MEKLKARNLLCKCDKSALKHFRKNDTINHMDITNEWTKKTKKGSVAEKPSYVVDDVTYTVDGKHVVLAPSDIEREIAVSLSEKYGKDVELIPKVNFPLGVQTPDYLIDGERFDLKSPKGSSKYLLKGMVTKKKRQAPNFVFDITNCPLDMVEIERQINVIFSSRQTEFVEKIAIMKNGEILKVYSKK